MSSCLLAFTPHCRWNINVELYLLCRTKIDLTKFYFVQECLFQKAPSNLNDLYLAAFEKKTAHTNSLTGYCNSLYITCLASNLNKYHTQACWIHVQIKEVGQSSLKLTEKQIRPSRERWYAKKNTSERPHFDVIRSNPLRSVAKRSFLLRGINSEHFPFLPELLQFPLKAQNKFV